MSEYFEIAYAAAANRLCFFTGTGFSKALTDNLAPGWRELLEAICDEHLAGSGVKEALFPGGAPMPLQLDEAAQVIAIELTKKDKNIHNEISSLISAIDLEGDFPEVKKFFSERSFRVVTTNYDKLAEQLAGDDCLSLTPGRPVPRLNSRAKIYHVHGSVDVPERMVVTANDYFKFMHSETYFSRKLSTILHENTVVIIGYSLGDTNLKTILNDYRSFVRNHVVSNSVFFVSRKPVDQRVSDYYSNCYGIRVISDTNVEQFFRRLNQKYTRADECLVRSKDDIHKVLAKKAQYSDKYLGIENSFYEIVSAISSLGVSLDDPIAVDVFADVIATKKSLAAKPNAWDQYVQLAAWVVYLGSLLDVKNSAVEETFLEAVKFSMDHMSNDWILGRSWDAYKVWDTRWNTLTVANRSLIKECITAKVDAADVLEVVNRG